jgi:hypothetical protein
MGIALRIALGTAICSAVVLSANAQEQKTQRHNIAGGIEGRIKSVDVDGHSLTITTNEGRARTFTITDETTMVGPRGGKVRHRLKDPRFREGFRVTIVANGTTAEEVHLGFAKGGDGKTTEHEVRRPSGAELEKTIRRPETAKNVATEKAATKLEEDDEDNEVPGRVVRMDAARRILVISLLNGKERSFLLPNDLKVLVRGAVSRQGLREPALKAGAHVEVVTDEGGHKVKEVKVTSASEGRSRKAG